MRILHIVTCLNRGGLECRLMDLYRNINRSEIQFDFYTNRATIGEFDAEVVELGGHVFYSNPINPLCLRKKEKEFRVFLMEHSGYDVIHSHVNEWSTIFCKAAMMEHIPVRIAHSRASSESNRLKAMYKKVIRIQIKRFATDYFAVSKEAGIYLFGKHTQDKGEVKVLPNAINTAAYSFDEKVRESMRKKLNLDNNFTIIHVGNFSPVKNHIFLLRIFEKVLLIDSNAKLVLVGDGDRRKEIENWVYTHNMEKSVILLGKRSDVPQLLMAADVFVFPSLHEGFSGAVLEAETSGLPCIISDTITKEMILTENVMQVSLKADPSDWADKVLFYKKHDRKDCVKEVKRAGFDIKDLSKRMEFFYKETIER